MLRSPLNESETSSSPAKVLPCTPARQRSRLHECGVVQERRRARTTCCCKTSSPSKVHVCTIFRDSTSHSLTDLSAELVAIFLPSRLNETAKTPLSWAVPAPESLNAPLSSAVVPSYRKTWPSEPAEAKTEPSGA